MTQEAARRSETSAPHKYRTPTHPHRHTAHGRLETRSSISACLLGREAGTVCGALRVVYAKVSESCIHRRTCVRPVSAGVTLLLRRVQAGVTPLPQWAPARTAAHAAAGVTPLTRRRMSRSSRGGWCHAARAAVIRQYAIGNSSYRRLQLLGSVCLRRYVVGSSSSLSFKVWTCRRVGDTELETL